MSPDKVISRASVSPQITVVISGKPPAASRAPPTSIEASMLSARLATTPREKQHRFRAEVRPDGGVFSSQNTPQTRMLAHLPQLDLFFFI